MAKDKSPLTIGVHHIVLSVKDPKKSKEFYNKACGMRVLSDEENESGVTDGEFLLGFRKLKKGEEKFNPEKIGIDHFAFKVKTMRGLRAVEKHLKNLGVEMEDGGITDDGYGGTGIFTKDPDGIKVEFKPFWSSEDF